MKRWVLRILVFLLIGAIVNVAVAWGCVFREGRFHVPPGFDRGFTREGHGYSDWFVMISGAAWFERIDSRWLTGSTRFRGDPPSKTAAELLPSYTDFGRPDGDYQIDTVVWRTTDARGWPLLCMWSGWEHIGLPGPNAVVGTVFDISNGYLIPNDRSKVFAQWPTLRVLPLAPIWPGFITNTLFYAVVLWLLFCGPFALRRRIRRKRGRCIKCNYDLRGDLAAGCPECGWNRGEAEA